MRLLAASAVVLWILCTTAGLATLQSVPGPPSIAPADEFVDDLRPQFPPTSPQLHGRRVPDLAALRSLPPPDGTHYGLGTFYGYGYLRVTSFAELSTTMIVHPYGLGVSVPRYLYTTATNRTERTIEVVGVYINNEAGLGIYDWSCLADSPCDAGQTFASWQWIRPLTDLPCYYAVGDDGGGHQHNLLSYVNRSRRRGNANRDGNGNGAERAAPKWTNSVLLFNQCTGEWNVVYSHDFRVVQRDCSVNPPCSTWGPIVETYNDDPQPAIKEVGFLNTTLTYDDSVSTLGHPDAFLDWPDAANGWNFFHAVPYGSWAFGSTTID